jgi:hypothetical protein
VPETARGVLGLESRPEGELVRAAGEVPGAALGSLDRDRAEVAAEKRSGALDAGQRATLPGAKLAYTREGDRAMVSVEGGDQDATVNSVLGGE